MNFLEQCKSIYYSQDTTENILSEIQERLNSKIFNISHEMLCIFYDALRKEPSCYFNKEVYEKTYSELENLYDKYNNISFNEQVIEHFFIGYNTYKQITNIINDLSQLNDNPEIKNRLYRIPTYVSIVEGCLTNLYRVIVLLLDQTTEKNLAANKKLGPLCEILKKNSFELLVKNVDVNIRNAINHGGVIFKENGNIIEFLYTEKHQQVSKSLNIYELDNLINKVYDIASGVLLGICNFINNHIDIMNVNKSESSSISFSLLALELSIPSIRIRSISELLNNKQLNIDIYIKNSDKNFIISIVNLLVMMIYERYSNYEKYMIFFSNERMQTGWLGFTNKNINNIITQKNTFADVFKEILHNKECVIFDPSDEEVDLHEIKYFRFPNYIEKDFKLNNIRDASVENRKRLKADLYINEIESKESILNILYKSIEWMKGVRNVASPKFLVKHGDVEADSLYINVYKKDRRKNKELLPNNENFVCFVDYNADGETLLVDGGLPNWIWKQFNHEKIDKIQIAWREHRYKTVHNFYKIGRNDLCPCGSGKKYKKCCVDKVNF